jgi:hypothetical protein
MKSKTSCTGVRYSAPSGQIGSGGRGRGGCLLVTSPPIGEALASRRAHDRTASALGIVNGRAYAVVVAEIEFRKILAQMLLTDMLIDAGHIAFEGLSICR